MLDCWPLAIAIWLGCLFFLLHQPGLARAGLVQVEAGKLLKMKGHAEYSLAGRDEWLPPQIGHSFCNGDKVRTGGNGQVALLMADETLIQLTRNSLFIFKDVAPTSGWNRIREVFPAKNEKTKKSTYGLDKGEMWLLNKNHGADIDVQTPAITAALRGTEFTIVVTDDGLSTVKIQEGMVQVANAHGALMVSSGEEAFARPGEAPQKRMMIEPENAVQWTILLPSLKDLKLPLDDQPAQDIMNLLSMGDLSLARQRLSALLAWQSKTVLRELMAIIALASGDGETALHEAGQAAALAPGDAMPWVIRAYALQAAFALPEALDAVDKALALEPDNVTALVVRGRLLFGMGHTSEAKETIRLALNIAPENGDVNTLHGFIVFAERSEREAEVAFRRAIAADASLAEPHLGLGLLAMRQGKEDEALEEISAAVLLEPRRALHRSYWAKILYQLHRQQKALDVLDISQKIDSRDPTPDLYRAIIYRDLRQPGLAIAAFNEAIRKNDNRAVYRSRLLLDRDLAVKNVDLSLMYDQLGLLSWARKKATTSIRDDYTNASAHLFYAGTLTGGDGRSWSRNSENLLARLLMPANANTFNTFNDYTTFFERPAFEADYSFTLGSQGTVNQDMMAFGALPAANLSYSVGYMPHATDGWQEGYFNRSRSLVGYAKWDVTPSCGLMASAARTSLTQGGRNAPRNEYDAPPEPRDSQESANNKYEVGYHFTVQPGAELLLHAAKVRDNEGILAYGQTIFPLPGIRLTPFKKVRLSPDYLLLQGEFIKRQGAHQFILGGFYNKPSGNGFYEDLIEIGPPPTVFSLQQTVFDDSSRMITGYLYDIWQIRRHLTLDAALYTDHLRKAEVISDDMRRREWSMDELGPRLGLVWTPFAGHSFHAVAFRAMLPLYGDTFAPADVAGVSVHRNGQTGTVTEEGDLVWEYEFGRGLLSNTLFSYGRRYNEPAASGELQGWLSRGGGLRSTLEILLGEMAGLAFNYRFDKIGDSNSALVRDEHFIAATLSWMNSLGFSFRATESYRSIGFDSQVLGHEDILLTDLRLGYDFPGKRGALQIQVNNLFDERFNWLTDTFVTEGRVPAREASVTLNLLY